MIIVILEVENYPILINEEKDQSGWKEESKRLWGSKKEIKMEKEQDCVNTNPQNMLWNSFSKYL